MAGVKVKLVGDKKKATTARDGPPGMLEEWQARAVGEDGTAEGSVPVPGQPSAPTPCGTGRGFRIHVPARTLSLSCASPTSTPTRPSRRPDDELVVTCRSPRDPALWWPRDPGAQQRYRRWAKLDGDEHSVTTGVCETTLTRAAGERRGENSPTVGGRTRWTGGPSPPGPSRPAAGTRPRRPPDARVTLSETHTANWTAPPRLSVPPTAPPARTPTAPAAGG